MLNYEILILGDLETNCYIVWDEETKDCFIIDPADDGVGISEEINSKNLNPKGILLTHGHFDHTMAALDLKLIYNIPVYCSQNDLFLLKRQNQTATHFLKRRIVTPNLSGIDVDLNETNQINIGNEKFEVIQTPGYTPGSVSFYNQENNLLFSGDTIFAGLRGRTDLKYSSTEEIFKSIKKIMKLPEDTIILSGHGEETTVGQESRKYIRD
jgi:glyoxylase-like metal-dependent hydrolase (beta-lactamase superfamily II)